MLYGMGASVAFRVDDRDGDIVVIRCEVCGFECQVPRHLTARRLREFFEQHPSSTAADVHARDCPAGWSCQGMTLT
jgi:hypothetical protein